MAGTASVAGEVFVDALPYFDQGYDAAGVREAVSKLRLSQNLAVSKPCLFQVAMSWIKQIYKYPAIVKQSNFRVTTEEAVMFNIILIIF